MRTLAANLVVSCRDNRGQRGEWFRPLSAGYTLIKKKKKKKKKKDGPAALSITRQSGEHPRMAARTLQHPVINHIFHAPFGNACVATPPGRIPGNDDT